MAGSLMDLFNEGIVLGDGGMYLEANWRGYEVPGIIGSHPEALKQIHRDFYDSGSQVLQALTWFTSGAQLEAKYGWGRRVDEINRTGIRVAKEGVRLGGAGWRLSCIHDDRLTAGRSGLRSGGSLVAFTRTVRVGRADCNSGRRWRGLPDSRDVFPVGRDATVRGKLQEVPACRQWR